MTAAARIPQSEIERALRAAVRFGGPGARVVIDHRALRLEIVPGEVPPITADEGDPWDDDDG